MYYTYINTNHANDWMDWTKTVPTNNDGWDQQKQVKRCDSGNVGWSILKDMKMKNETKRITLLLQSQDFSPFFLDQKSEDWCTNQHLTPFFSEQKSEDCHWGTNPMSSSVCKYAFDSCLSLKCSKCICWYIHTKKSTNQPANKQHKKTKHS